MRQDWTGRHLSSTMTTDRTWCPMTSSAWPQTPCICICFCLLYRINIFCVIRATLSLCVYVLSLFLSLYPQISLITLFTSLILYSELVLSPPFLVFLGSTSLSRQPCLPPSSSERSCSRSWHWQGELWRP